MCYFPLEDAIWKVPDSLTKRLTKEEVGTVRFIAAYVAKVFPHLNLTLRLETGSVFKGPQKCTEYSSRIFFVWFILTKVVQVSNLNCKNCSCMRYLCFNSVTSPKSAGCKILPDLCFYISESQI